MSSSTGICAFCQSLNHVSSKKDLLFTAGLITFVVLVVGTDDDGGDLITVMAWCFG